jgi:large subunit ribosomal protein L18
LKLIISKKNMVVVRKSTRHIQIQLIIPTPIGDKTLVSAVSSELKKYGYDAHTGNTSAAYLTGLLFGYKAQIQGHDSGILNIGLQSPSHGCRIYAAFKGVADSGMNVPYDESVSPSDERIKGTIEQFESIKEKIISEFEK